MKDVVVVDASIALKWVQVEADSATALALVTEWVNNSMTVLAPGLLIYEITNVLYKNVRKNLITLDGARDALREIFLSKLELDFSEDPAQSIRALELAHRFGLLAAYDPQYLALAEREDCEYWTADERLWNSVKRELAWVRWLGEFHPAP